MILFHTSSGGIENRILAITENHLTDHRESQGVGSHLGINEPQNRFGGVTEI